MFIIRCGFLAQFYYIRLTYAVLQMEVPGYTASETLRTCDFKLNLGVHINHANYVMATCSALPKSNQAIGLETECMEDSLPLLGSFY